MAWTSPMTAVANQIFTATQFNTNIRDNLLECAPAAALAGQFFVANGANSLEGHTPDFGFVVASETTSSTSYVDLTTIGPSQAKDVSSKALVMLIATISNSTANAGTLASFEMSGANTATVSDNWAIITDGGIANAPVRCMTAHLFTGLTPGQTTWTSKYRVGSGTGTFAGRYLMVIPF